MCHHDVHETHCTVGMLLAGLCVCDIFWVFKYAQNLCAIITLLLQCCMHPTSAGVILLAGLFVYDIFWVFCTPVMVAVAKSFDAPIKLLFQARRRYRAAAVHVSWQWLSKHGRQL